MLWRTFVAFSLPLGLAMLWQCIRFPFHSLWLCSGTGLVPFSVIGLGYAVAHTSCLLPAVAPGHAQTHLFDFFHPNLAPLASVTKMRIPAC